MSERKNVSRRDFLRIAFAGTSVAALVATGLISPEQVDAAAATWPAFDARVTTGDVEVLNNAAVGCRELMERYQRTDVGLSGLGGVAFYAVRRDANLEKNPTATMYKPFRVVQGTGRNYDVTWSVDATGKFQPDPIVMKADGTVVDGQRFAIVSGANRGNVVYDQFGTACVLNQSGDKVAHLNLATGRFEWQSLKK